MKKPFLLAGMSFVVSLIIPACASSDPAKVYVPFGKLFDVESSVTAIPHVDRHLVNINHARLTSMVGEGKSFCLLVYDQNNSCVCWDTFQYTLFGYLERTNAMIYGIAPTEFDGGHETFTLSVAASEETVAIFENGSLRYQKVTSGVGDEFTTEAGFNAWMDERVYFSDMLFVTKSQLDSLFLGDAQFTVGYLRTSCPDCAYVEDHVLFEYNKKQRNRSYLIDCDSDDVRFVAGTTTVDSDKWQAFKDEYGLSSALSADYGYGVGYVPTFFTYRPGVSSKAEAIVDGAVYLNDTIALEGDVYKVTESYYTTERQSILGFLGNGVVETAVLKGLTISENDVSIFSYGGTAYVSWKKEAAAIYHNPLLEAFLDAYISLS